MIFKCIAQWHKHIHIVIQSSHYPAPELFRLPKLKLCTHLTVLPLPSAPGNHHFMVSIKF